MILRCPVCRADNETGPLCRRCKADLGPLFELESRRKAALEAAARAAGRANGALVVHCARQARLLRPGPDVMRWLAAGFLLERDFGRALACWQHAAG